MVDYKF